MNRYRLAVEVARITGESIAEAVGNALEARLTDFRRERDRDDVAKQLMGIGRECVREAPSEWTTRDFDAELYDDRGMPK